MSNVVMIIMMIAFGFIVAEIAKSKGYVLKSGEKKEKGEKNMYYYFVWWLCGAVAFLIALIWVLVLPNKNKG